MNVLPAAILMTEPSWLKKQQSAKPSLKAREKYPKIRSVSQMVQQLQKIGEHTEVVLAVTTQKSSPRGDSSEVQKSEDGFQQTARKVSVFSRNGVDNLAFMDSKTDLSEKSSEVVEVNIT